VDIRAARTNGEIFMHGVRRHGRRTIKKRRHFAGDLPSGVVLELGSFPVMPRPPLPVVPDAVTKPLSQAAVNSAWESLPSLLVSAALKSLTMPCAWLCDSLPDFVASALFQTDVHSARLIFVAVAPLGLVVVWANAGTASARRAVATKQPMVLISISSELWTEHPGAVSTVALSAWFRECEMNGSISAPSKGVLNASTGRFHRRSVIWREALSTV
jgi:hypothetical protein